jgi:hypothetical protein
MKVQRVLKPHRVKRGAWTLAALISRHLPYLSFRVDPYVLLAPMQSTIVLIPINPPSTAMNSTKNARISAAMDQLDSQDVLNCVIARTRADK